MVRPATLGPVSSNERFWATRLRWRLRGAWMWPAFVALTLADGVLLHLLPPVRLGVRSDGMTVIFGIIVATFGNLFLIGVVAPWLARKLAARADSSVPRDVRLEMLRDRVGTALLAAGLLGVLAAGLGSRPVVVSETEATEENARAVKSFVEASGDRELIRNLETANTIKLGEGFFRTCIARDDRRRAFCLYVDTDKQPTEVRRDPSAQPNSDFLPR
jgi:hypothetical protein